MLQSELEAVRCTRCEGRESARNPTRDCFPRRFWLVEKTASLPRLAIGHSTRFFFLRGGGRRFSKRYFKLIVNFMFSRQNSPSLWSTSVWNIIRSKCTSYCVWLNKNLKPNTSTLVLFVCLFPSSVLLPCCRLSTCTADDSFSSVE